MSFSNTLYPGLLAFVLVLVLVLVLVGCSDTCESVQDDIEKIGRDISKDPGQALDEKNVKELETLTDKLRELGCVG